MKTTQTQKLYTFQTLGCSALVAVMLAVVSGSLLASPVTLTARSAQTRLGRPDRVRYQRRLTLLHQLHSRSQAQGITQHFQVVFAPGVTSIQLSARLSMVNLLGSDNVVIGNPDPAPPVVIKGGAGTGGLFIRQGQSLSRISISAVYMLPVAVEAMAAVVGWGPAARFLSTPRTSLYIMSISAAALPSR